MSLQLQPVTTKLKLIIADQSTHEIIQVERKDLIALLHWVDKADSQLRNLVARMHELAGEFPYTHIPVELTDKTR